MRPLRGAVWLIADRRLLNINVRGIFTITKSHNLGINHVTERPI